MQLNRAIRSARAKRVLLFVLALAACCQQPAGAQSSFWPIKWETDFNATEIQTDDTQATAQDLIFSVDMQTRIVADNASTDGELFVSGDSTGISARLKAMEDELEDIRQEYNTMMSLDSLETAKTDCNNAKDSLTARIAALETALDNDQATVPYELRPPKCDASGVAGLRRELDANQNLVWTCPCANNYTSSATDTCDVAPCQLPADFDDFATSSIIQNCAKEFLAVGSTCTFSCDNKKPVGATDRSEHSFTCTTSADLSSDTDLACEDCVNNNTGTNCATTACDLSSTGGLSNTGVTNFNCGSYLAAGAQCEYECAADSEPTDTNPVANTGNGRIKCDDAGSTASITAGCQACANQESGVNCATPSCNLATNGGYTEADGSNVDTVASTCGLNGNYLKANTNCVYSCADGYMPNTLATTGTTRQVDCSVSGTAITSSSNAVSSNSNQLTCVTCDTASFTNYTGKNCQTAACALPASLSSVTHNCGVTNMKEGGSCEYSCPSGKMPSAVTTAGTSGSISCTSGSVSAHTCTDCNTQLTTDQNRTGVNCATAACDVPATARATDNDHTCGTKLEVGDSCTFNCPADKMPGGGTIGQSGTVTCGAGSTVSGETTCVACENELSGVNCVTPSCDLASRGYAETEASHVVSSPTSTCGLGSGYLKAGTSCEYSCGDGYMPNTFTSTNTPRRVDCSADGLTTKSGTASSPNQLTVTTTSNELTCVACGTASSAFTNYTGDNCQTPSCLVNTVLSDDTAVIDSTCGTSMKADGTCAYSCDAGFMPTGLTNVGESRTLTCDTGGTDITAAGFDPANDPPAPACTACTNGSDQVNCVLQTGTGGNGNTAG